ncbi:MAG TPA: hypothetical protein ENJ89_08205, partial [Caldithrix abyssi]|nr:hypothetical protein [Caldithrix abyssi]
MHTMYADRLGRIWLGTFEGLFRYDPADSRILSMSETSGRDFGMVLDMAGDQQGRIWIAGTGNGLFCFDSGKKRFFHYKKGEKNSQGLNSNRIASVLMDSNGNLWVGTVDRGLNVWFAGTDRFVHYVHDLSDSRSVVNGAIFALYEDKNGGIWIGSYGGGVCRYDPHQPPFHQITHRPHDRSGLSSNIVLSICEDHQGKLWVGTDGGGLNVLEPESNSFRHYFRQAGIKSSNSITALMETSDKTLWLGMDVGGQSPGGLIYRFNRSLKRFERFELIRPKFGGVSVFMEDHRGRLWIGTFAEGLYCYDRQSNKVTHLVFDKKECQGLCGNSILSLQEDDSGQIWIGTLNRGLDRYNPMTGKFTHFEAQPNNPKSLCGNSVFSMAKDGEGRLWFGTNGGLNGRLADNDAFFSLTTTDGLPGNLIYGILSDSAGQLWLSTNRGLVCFNPKKGAIKKYGPADGLLNFEFTQGAYCKGRNGALYFGGNKGLTYFNPDDFKENQYEPPVVLTDFLVKGKKFKLKNSILFTKRIVLSYRQNFFSFKFAALDYRASGKNEYAYCLTGVDDDWVYCGHRRFADYTDIAPGEYVFKAKATNSDGIWGQKRATV